MTFAHWKRGPFTGQPLVFRSISDKSRIALMTAGRRLQDAAEQEGAKSAYDRTRAARAVACAILGGFLEVGEARALKTLWTSKSNKHNHLPEAAVLFELSNMLGIILQHPEANERGAETLRALRRSAISSFVKTFDDDVMRLPN